MRTTDGVDEGARTRDEGGVIARRLGFRRLDFVRLELDGDAIHAEAVGIAHRLPCALPLPLSVATRLVRDGARLVVDDRRVATAART